MTPGSIKAAERKYWAFICVICAPILLLTIFKAEVSQWVSASLAAMDITVRPATLELVLIGAGLVLLFGGIFSGHRWFLAHCPQCNKPIYPNSAGIVIATKNCPSCGSQVISDESKS